MAEADAGQGPSYRDLIIERLELNKQKLRQVQTLFKNYSILADQLNKTRTRTRLFSDGEINVGNSLTEVQQLRNEIAEVYRTKSKNDQELIDSRRKLEDTEAQLSSVTIERNNLKAEIERLCAKIAKLEVEMAKVRMDNQTVNDERIALNATCTSLTAKKEEMEMERIQLLNKIRELNEQRAEYMNAEVALQEQRRQLKIQEEIAKAVQDTSRDEATNNLLRHLSKEPIGDILLGDIMPGHCSFKFQAIDGEVSEVEWLTGETFAVGGSDRMITVFRVENYDTQTKVCTLTGCNAAVTRIDYDAEKRNLLASSNDKNVRLWNIDNQRMLSTLSGHTDKVSCARFHQATHVVSGSFDRMIKVWDLISQRCSRSFFPGSTVLDIIGKPSLSSSAFVSGHLDKKIRFWDGRASDCVHILEMGNKVTSLDLSIDGRHLLCSTRDDTLSLIDLRNYQIVHYYSAEQYRTSSDLARCILSPGGDYVAAGSSMGSVFIWNTHTTRIEKILRGGNDNAILSLSWNPTGQGMLSADRQKTVAYWR